MVRKRTIWAQDLAQFNDEDQMRWSFGGGGKAGPPPTPPPEPRDDGRPDNAKSKGIEEASRMRTTQRKKGSRGGLKIAMNKGGATGIATPGKSETL